MLYAVAADGDDWVTCWMIEPPTSKSVVPSLPTQMLAVTVVVAAVLRTIALFSLPENGATNWFFSWAVVVLSVFLHCVV